MFASFSSTESGCDQCADVNTAFNSPVQNVNNAVSQYAQGAQMMNAQQQQYHNTVMNSNSVGLNQNTAQLNTALNNLQPPANTMMNNRQQSNGQAAMQQMIQKAVAKPNVNSGRIPTTTTQTSNSNNAKEVVVEAFEQPQPVQVNIPSRLILTNLAVVVSVALSVNEAFKYYINRGLQMADGTPHYYAFYALGALVVAALVHYASTRYMSN